MAPKVKITKQDIIDKALEIVRESGDSGINARSIAAALGCSTQPIFSNFNSMEEIEESVLLAAYNRYQRFISSEVQSGKYPKYKAFGMSYVRFAKEEKELFKMLFMCDKQKAVLLPTAEFDSSVEMIVEANGISYERAKLMHLEMWACVHGIATMLATSFFTPDWETISIMLTDMYHGLREKHIKEENQNGGN